MPLIYSQLRAGPNIMNILLRAETGREEPISDDVGTSAYMNISAFSSLLTRTEFGEISDISDTEVRQIAHGIVGICRPRLCPDYGYMSKHCI